MTLTELLLGTNSYLLWEETCVSGCVPIAFPVLYLGCGSDIVQ